MTSTTATDLGDSLDGLPRRRALQGLAGSLAGIAALSAVNASAKKKKKKSQKGTLVRFETADETESIPTAVPTTVSVACPAAGGNEQVFATGGGFETTPVGLTMFVLTSQVAGNGDEWEATFLNTAAAQNATVSVVCAYFKTK
jgi:hypothetical protein